MWRKKTFFKSLNCNKAQNSIFDKTQLTIKLKNSNCYKLKNSHLTTRQLKFWQLAFGQNLKQSFGKNNWTPWQPMRGSRCSVLQCFVFLNYQPNEKLNYLNKLSNYHIRTQIYKKNWTKNAQMGLKEYFWGMFFLMFAIIFF